jgi:hypothetical protein
VTCLSSPPVSAVQHITNSSQTSRLVRKVPKNLCVRECEIEVTQLATPAISLRRQFILNAAQSAQFLQPSNEDITLETLVEPELLITVGQLI